MLDESKRQTIDTSANLHRSKYKNTNVISFWHEFLCKVAEPCPEGLVLVLKLATYFGTCLIIILTTFPLKVEIKGKTFQLSMITDRLTALFGCLLISFYTFRPILNTTKTSAVQVQERISLQPRTWEDTFLLNEIKGIDMEECPQIITLIARPSPLPRALEIPPKMTLRMFSHDFPTV